MAKYDSLLVLDFDGVLNNLGTQITGNNGVIAMDPTSVALVSQLIQDTGAKVLVSSSWRTGDVETFRKLLMTEWRKRLGDADPSVILNSIVGLTPDLGFLYKDDRMTRGREIASWIDTHSVNRYAIVDDDTCVLPHQLPYFIKTNYVDGFRVVHYWRALKILMPEHPRVKGLEQFFNKRYYKDFVDQLIDDQPNPDGE